MVSLEYPDLDVGCALSWKGALAYNLASHWRVDGGPTSPASLQRVALFNGGWVLVSG